MIARLKCDRGQAVTLMVLALTGVTGATALVLDVGSWFRAQRNLQAIADGAALAGAQALPENAATAFSQAQANASKNGFSLSGSNVSITSDGTLPSDEITVDITQDQPGFFSKVLGINAATVHVKATAVAQSLGKARYVAPIAVDKNHPLLNCGGGANATCSPTFGVQTTLDLIKLKKNGQPTGAGNFGLVDLSNSGGSASTGDIATWIQYGYNDALPLGWYDGAPGAKFDSGNIDGALTIRTGDILLFPIYDKIVAGGSNLQFHIIGWVGFRVTGFVGSGSDGTITGTFESYVGQGLESSDSTQPYFGVKKITLIG